VQSVAQVGMVLVHVVTGAVEMAVMLVASLHMVFAMVQVLEVFAVAKLEFLALYLAVC